MQRPPRLSAILLLTAAALAAVHPPARRSALAFLRLPLTVVRGCVQTVFLLPRLPALARENAALRSTLTERQLEVAGLREALRHEREAAALRAAVPDAGRGGLVASIIGRSLLPTQQTAMLDKGRRHGLGLDGVIVDAHGVVGRVVELHPASALVLLLTDPDSRIAAMIERSRDTGLLVGQGLGQCELMYLDTGADVQVGDRVITAGLGGPIPKGLLLGTVTRVMADERESAASAHVAPAARLGRLEEVLCLPPSDHPDAPASHSGSSGVSQAPDVGTR